MKKNYILTFFVLLTNIVFGQKEFFETVDSFKISGYNSKESLAISNFERNELVLLVEGNDETTIILLNNSGKEISRLTTERLLLGFSKFLGYHFYSDGSYGIVFSETTNKSFGILRFNFERKEISQRKLNFVYKKQKYVESFSQNGKFYLITLNKGKSTDANFYVFQDDDTFKNNVVPFEFFSENIEGFIKKPISILTQRYLGNGSLTKIDPLSPSSIVSNAAPNKLYQILDKVYITTDGQKGYTKIMSIDLNDFTITTKKYGKPFFKLNTNGVEGASHNSFMHKGLLYQLKASSNEMKLTVKQLSNDELIKDIHLRKEDSITFKNGPIHIEKSTSTFFGDTNRDVEKTAKFLRKVSLSKAGITVDEINETIQLAIGGYIELKSSGGMMPGGFGGIPMGSFGAFSVSFSPTFYNFNSYKSSRTVYIDCLFDKKFNHLSGEIKDNIFGKIKNYEDNFKENSYFKQNENGIKFKTEYSQYKMKLKNVFYHNGKHYLGYIQSKTKKYHLVEFDD